MAEFQDAAQRFANDTAKHEMTVLHDDGLFRHIRFAQPDQRGYWFSLTTWPQKLVINGSVGTYVFSCTEDMFELVRESCPMGEPNITYWHEKVVASGEPAHGFSPDLFDKHVAEVLAEAEKDWPGVTEEWNEKVNGYFAEYDTTHEYGARAALHDFTYQPWDVKPAEAPFHFYDTNDWKLRDYDWKYLWSCHAIRWGIRQYDSMRANAEAQAAAVAS